MSRIFRRVQFTDYLGELRAIDDIYDDNLPEPFPTGFTVSNQTGSAENYNGHYSLVNTDLVGKYIFDSPREVRCNVGEPQFALFVKDDDPQVNFGIIDNGTLLWGFPNSGFSGYTCGSTSLPISINVLLYQPSFLPVTAYQKINTLSYPPEGTYRILNLFNLTYEYYGG
jgi:hypothetical protein